MSPFVMCNSFAHRSWLSIHCSWGSLGTDPLIALKCITRCRLGSMMKGISTDTFYQLGNSWGKSMFSMMSQLACFFYWTALGQQQIEDKMERLGCSQSSEERAHWQTAWWGLEKGISHRRLIMALMAREMQLQVGGLIVMVIGQCC